MDSQIQHVLKHLKLVIYFSFSENICMCYRNEIKMKESNLQQRFYKMYQQTLKKKKKSQSTHFKTKFSSVEKWINWLQYEWNTVLKWFDRNTKTQRFCRPQNRIDRVIVVVTVLCLAIVIQNVSLVKNVISLV